MCFINSIKQNYKGIGLMLISAICVASGQLFWKFYTNSQSLWHLLLGFGLYGIGAILMTLSFRFGKLSVLHPLLATSYVFALGLSYFVLKEIPSAKQLMGIVLIAIGATLIGGSDK